METVTIHSPPKKPVITIVIPSPQGNPASSAATAGLATAGTVTAMGAAVGTNAIGMAAAAVDAEEIVVAAEAGELSSEMLILGGVGLADTIAGGFVTGAMLGGAAGAVLGIGVAIIYYEIATHP